MQKNSGILIFNLFIFWRPKFQSEENQEVEMSDRVIDMVIDTAINLDKFHDMSDIFRSSQVIAAIATTMIIRRRSNSKVL